MTAFYRTRNFFVVFANVDELMSIGWEMFTTISAAARNMLYSDAVIHEKR